MADLEQLTVTLNAKIDQFKAGMNQAVKEFDASAGAIDAKNKELTDSIDRNMRKSADSTTFLVSAFKQLLTVAVFEKLAKGIIEANSQLAKMAETAELAGVSVRKLQEINFANKTLGGVDPQQTEKGVHDLTLKAAEEVRNGEGKLTTLLADNNMKLTDRQGKLKNINELLTMAATLTSRAKDEADKIKIAELFGLTEDWVKSLDKGAKAFGEAQEKAQGAGAIINDETIKKAQEFEAKWSQAWSNFATYAKVAAVEIAEYFKFLDILKLIPGAIEAVRHAAGYGKETSDEAKQVLDQTIARQVPGNFDTKAVEKAQKQYVEALQREAPEREREEIAKRGQQTGHQFGPFPEGDPRNDTNKTVVRGGKTQKEGSADDFEKAYNSLLKQNEGLRAQAAAEGLVGKAIDEKVAFEKISQAAQEAGIKLTQQDIEDTHKLAAEYANLKENLAKVKLERDVAFGYSQLGRTKEEAAAAATVRGKGIDPDSDVGKEQIRNLERLHDLTEAKDTAGSFIKGMISDMQNGVRAGQALENQLKRIADKLLDRTLDAALSGLFKAGGGLFGLGSSTYGASDYAAAAASAAPGSYGPGFASGGIVGRDGVPMFIPASAWRGAKAFASGGGVPALVHEGELILNRAQQKNVLSSMQGNAGPITLTHAPIIQGAGLSQDQLTAVLARNNREFERRIGPIFSDWNRRFGNQFDQ